MRFFDYARRRRIGTTTNGNGNGNGIREINTGERSSDVCSLAEAAFVWVDDSQHYHAHTSYGTNINNGIQHWRGREMAWHGIAWVNCKHQYLIALISNRSSHIFSLKLGMVRFLLYNFHSLSTKRPASPILSHPTPSLPPRPSKHLLPSRLQRREKKKAR